ncbi:hypothetical protein M441DRAFT_70309 [Trichoderma asperellum CBS 433.97]|uniref:Uncharacterized protein n=1 Tax=Trichoderma asperellum (strain ATCC 204424 / CBS 433.97 / NBRC 101777) TaxID=1042311 RepID=A0A2T3Z2Y2_TRIA4|nr:hypothetical protein M441DRAFT_70309 [Trichoderma asperellum CBS 433.97]PTB39164.1 hypothetical protein M441DRAFT_70309 [Trichoderma asperellum CBS 433.97]
MCKSWTARAGVCAWVIGAVIVRGLNSGQRVAQKTGEARGFIYQISSSGLGDVAPQIERDAEMR